MTIEIGDKIPAFRTESTAGPLTHKDFQGHVSVLYFYPKDDTSGCTKEACGFQESLPTFKKLKVHVYGVSKDSLASHGKFAKKYDLSFPLISDSDGSLCDSFGAWVEKSMYGKKYMGIERSTFLVDEKGVIRHVWRKVKVPGHIEDVVNKIKNIL